MPTTEATLADRSKDLVERYQVIETFGQWSYTIARTADEKASQAVAVFMAAGHPHCTYTVLPIGREQGLTDHIERIVRRSSAVQAPGEVLEP